MTKRNIDETNIPTLEYCSFRQALDYLNHGLKPIPAHLEKIIRIDINRYGDSSEKPKNPAFLQALLTGVFFLTGVDGEMYNYYTEHPHMLSFRSKGQRKSFSINDLQFDRIDYDNSAMFNFPNIDYDIDGPIPQDVNVPAIGEIQIPFKELQEYAKKQKEQEAKMQFEPTYADEFELVFEDNTIYLQVNGKNRFEIKKLSKGDTKTIFEYIYKNPNKLLTDVEIKKEANVKKWDNKADRLDQRMRNIFSDKNILNNVFPVLKSHEVKFTPKFTLPSESNMDWEVPF
ncbi:MAG: hypothetical protein FWG80_03395 [Alphaproteobacteria bacterium]|nr:hypothetical protein [Alphaproteobacteria bacterium]